MNFGLYVLVQTNLEDGVEWRVGFLNYRANPQITLSYVKLSLPLGEGSSVRDLESWREGCEGIEHLSLQWLRGVGLGGNSSTM